MRDTPVYGLKTPMSQMVWDIYGRPLDAVLSDQLQEVRNEKGI